MEIYPKMCHFNGIQSQLYKAAPSAACESQGAI